MIDDRSIQRAMQAAGFYAGPRDGAFGPASRAAARKMASRRSPRYAPAWPDARVRIAVEQAIMADAGAYTGDLDGLAGPATQAALEKWQDHLTFERPALPDAAVVYQRGAWPREAGIEKFYGAPGQNQVRLLSPYPLKLDWALSESVSGFLCHEKVHDAMARVMHRVLSAYGPQKIVELGLDQFGGCLNVRPMRNGTRLSTHAWGIAIDWDADRNPLRAGRDRAQMAKPDYARFLDLWEEEGFVSLGRARNFDWMHVQAARL